MPRRSKVDTSQHKEEITRLLIEYRWSSRSVARYLELKYGESIPPSTLRTWRQRKLNRLRRDGKLPEIWNDPDPEDMSGPARVSRLTTTPDEIPDLVGRRLALVQMQEERIKLDLQHEIAMGKLFSSQRHELELLNKLYDSVKEDLQDLGVLPSREAVPQTQVNVQAAAMASGGEPSRPEGSITIGEMFPGVDAEELTTFTRALVVASRDDDE